MVNVRHGKTLRERKTDKSETKTQIIHALSFKSQEKFVPHLAQKY